MSDNSTKNNRGLGDFLEGLNGLLELVTRIQEKGSEGLKKSGEFKTENGTTGVYGVHIRAAQGGPVFEQFGNIGKGHGARLLNDEREPLVDMFEETDQITIVAEIPGASEDSIEISTKGDSLTLTAAAKDRKYNKELKLPFELAETPLRRSYINGIFSVVYQRQVQPASNY